MRKIIAALQVSLDGFIEGPNQELGWVDSWEDSFDIIGKVDAFILGARMYPGTSSTGRPYLTIREASCRSLADPPPRARSHTPSSPAKRGISLCRARCGPSRGRTRQSFATSRKFAD